MTDSEKLVLKTQLSAVFRPSAPIEKQALFAGRKQQIDRLTSAILQTGQHILLYGERGIGKTSLARVLGEVLSNAGVRTVHTDTLNCDSTDDFSSLWHRALRDLTFKAAVKSGRTSSFSNPKEADQEWAGLLQGTVTPDDVRRALLNFTGRGAVIIFDEFDRVTNKEAKTLMADTIKNLSDHGMDATLLIVGVAKSVAELISEHRSIDRAIVEVPVPRLSHEELSQILRKGFLGLKINLSDEVHDKIVILSHGLPFYTHTMAFESGRAAIERDSSIVEQKDLEAALSQIVRSKHSIANEYKTAVRSSQKSSKHNLTLLACALTRPDAQGFFEASEVAHTMAALFDEKCPVSHIPRHLSEFIEFKRGHVLERVGLVRQCKYRFANPLLQPYTIISSLSDQLVMNDKVWALRRLWHTT